jgi:ribonuclease P protein component
MTIKSLSSSQIALIMKKGRAYNSGSFLLKISTDGSVLPKFEENNVFNCSFIASKKVFIKAVDRNKAKRIMKESFLQAIKEIELAGLKVFLPPFIFLAKKDVFKNSFANIVYDIKQFLLKDYII